MKLNIFGGVQKENNFWGIPWTGTSAEEINWARRFYKTNKKTWAKLLCLRVLGIPNLCPFFAIAFFLCTYKTTKVIQNIARNKRASWRYHTQCQLFTFFLFSEVEGAEEAGAATGGDPPAPEVSDRSFSAKFTQGNESGWWREMLILILPNCSNKCFAIGIFPACSFLRLYRCQADSSWAVSFETCPRNIMNACFVQAAAKRSKTNPAQPASTRHSDKNKGT